MSFYLHKLEPTEQNPFRFYVDTTSAMDATRFDKTTSKEMLGKMLKLVKLDDVPHEDVLSALPEKADPKHFTCAINFCDVVDQLNQSPALELRQKLFSRLSDLSKDAGPLQKVITAFKTSKQYQLPPTTPRRSSIEFFLCTALEKLCLAGTPVHKHQVGANGTWLMDQVVLKSPDKQAKEEEQLVFSLFEVFGNTRTLPFVDVHSLCTNVVDPKEAAHLSHDSLDAHEIQAILKNLKPGFKKEDYEDLIKNKKNVRVVASQCLDSLSEQESLTYHSMKNRRWKSAIIQGTAAEVSYYTLLKLSLAFSDSMDQFLTYIPPDETTNLKKFFKLPWFFKSEEVLLKDRREDRPLIAKRRAHGLTSMLEMTPDRRKLIFENVDNECQVALLLTALFQFLDFHGDNIGFELAATVQTNPFVGYQFVVNNETLSIHDLAKRWACGKIDPNQQITVQKEKHIVFQGTMDSCKPLMETIQKWKLVIFDADMCMAEDNELQYMGCKTGGTSVQHFVPFRSALLATDWARRELPKEVWDTLLDKKREQRILDWINGGTSELFTKLGPQMKNDILQRVHNELSDTQYSLSHVRRKGDYLTPWHEIVAQFADCTKHTQFWEFMQKCTYDVRQKEYSVRAGDSISSIAEACGMQVLDFCEMNKDLKILQGKELQFGMQEVAVSGENETVRSFASRCETTPVVLFQANPHILLLKGTKLQYVTDLTHNSAAAAKDRSEILSSCFPKISMHQKEALIERFTKCRTYMKNYEALCGNTLSKDALEGILKDPSTPLSSFERRSFLQALSNNGNQPKAIQDSLVELIPPTYTTLAQAMYPLLPDCMELFEEIVPDSYHHIGSSTQSIERAVLAFVNLDEISKHESMDLQMFKAAVTQDLEDSGKVDVVYVATTLTTLLEKFHTAEIQVSDRISKITQGLCYLISRIGIRQASQKLPFYAGPFAPALKKEMPKLDEKKKS